jgi:hypothetical protein
MVIKHLNTVPLLNTVTTTGKALTAADMSGLMTQVQAQGQDAGMSPSTTPQDPWMQGFITDTTCHGHAMPTIALIVALASAMATIS